MASVLATTSGTYRVQWRESGKNRQKNFDTRAEAKRFAALVELALRKPQGSPWHGVRTRPL